jgi:hypothetical protein
LSFRFVPITYPAEFRRVYMVVQNAKTKGLVKPRWGIRSKILVPYLALSIVALGVISAFALRNMSTVGRIAINNTISLGD